jgi:hypothetical protein
MKALPAAPWAALAMLLLTAASPAPATDLREVLAAPPSADYAEQTRTPSVADGPYDPATYAAFLSPDGALQVREELTAAGFTRAFARTWVRPPQGKYVPGSNPQRTLIEIVEEYGSADQAGARFTEWRAGDLTSLVTPLDSSEIPDSFAYRVEYSGPARELFRAVFVKGNDVYLVDMLSGVDDLSADLIAQAGAQFQLAPASTIPPYALTSAAPGASPASPASQAPGAGVAAGHPKLDWRGIGLIALGVGMAGLVVMVLVVQRRQESQSLPPPRR